MEPLSPLFTNDHTDPPQAGKASRITVWLERVIALLAFSFSLFTLVTLVLFPLPPWVQLAACLAFTLVLTLLLHPGPFGSARSVPNVLFNLILGTGCLVALFHYATDFEAMLYRIIMDPTALDIFSSVMLVFGCIEICRRTTGWGLTLVALVFLAYTLFGQFLPGELGHGGFNPIRVFTRLYNDAGIFGTPLDAACTYVFLFIIFGEFLNRFGGGEVFMELATGVAGHYKGGPAKVAVLSSALFGTIAGSSIANVAATGSFTIPLMKRVGYRPAFAGAVEAAASTGGQIMPPVMGATAFILAEMVGVPYAEVALKSLIPALLYFFAVLVMVHCEALKSNLQGIPKEELPDVKQLLRRRWAYLLPIVVIFTALLGFGVSTSRAALCGIGATILVPFILPGVRVSFSQCALALVQSSKNILSIIAACGVAGIVIGALGITGLGGKIGTLLLTLSYGHIFPMLLAGMVLSIVLGMGLPSAAAYIIAASVVGPALTMTGLPMFSVHMFICYYAVLSVVTPPVALASYTAAGIAGANANAVGLEAFRLTMAGFLVPFMFIYSPALILEGSTMEIIWACITASAGVVFLGCGLQRYCFGVLTLLQSVLLLAGALLSIYSGIVTDLIGFACAVLAMSVPAQRRAIISWYSQSNAKMS